MRIATIGTSLAAALLVALPASAEPTRTDVSFEVNNLLTGTETLHGFRMAPVCEATSVVLLQHGLSYTSEAWDVPGYSTARILADAGYAVVAIDRLGYGRSVLDNGYNVSTVAYPDMAHQVVLELREEFDQVAIGGHSAGGEASETEAALFGDVDALMVLGYHHYPSSRIVQDFFTGDYPRAALSDYEYFLGTPEHRAEMFFTEHADPAVVAADAEAAVLTPSGEILSIGPQPSRYVHFLTPVPVFLQMASHDRLFPLDYPVDEALPDVTIDLRPVLPSTFVGAESVTLDEVPDAGHTFMLHPTGPAAAERMIAWLQDVAGVAPCDVSAAGGGDVLPQADEGDDGNELPASGGGLAVAALMVLGVVAGARRR
ncbi:MAG TPA: alpha/beta hydrolase family protein [Nitriliruptorales bacterium]